MAEYGAMENGGRNCGSVKVLAAVLGAGSSTRMGRSKLTAPFAGTTLIERAVGAALSSCADAVVVISGAYQGEMSSTLAKSHPGAVVLENPRWRSGQSSSVRLAAEYAQQSGFDALLLFAGDQPFVERWHLDRLIQAARSIASSAEARSAPTAVLSSRGRRRGNPCLFFSSCFALLQGLAGDEGARSLFGPEHGLNQAEVAFGNDELFLDADTPEEFVELEKRYERRRSPAPESDFPLLEERGSACPGFSFLDSAASSCAAKGPLDAVRDFETKRRANIHRGIYPLSEEATEAYEEARAKVGRFFGGDARNVVFTHGATEALNMAALGWGGNALREGDVVLLDTAAHHSAIVPWQMLSERIGLKLEFIGLDASGALDMERYRRLLECDPRAVVLTHVSNVTGLACDAKGAVALAHAAGACAVLDCAQSAGHMPVDLADIDADFAAVSAHKMHGPFGVGMLWGKEERFERMLPLLGGGGMIARVTEDGYVLSPPPRRFEAGTPNVSGAIGFAASCDYLAEVGLESIERHGRALSDRFVRGASEIRGISLLGTDAQGKRNSLVSFNVEGMHPHDVAEALAESGICVRAGTHCAMPAHAALGARASVRASFAAHTSCVEVDMLLDALRRLDAPSASARGLRG